MRFRDFLKQWKKISHTEQEQKQLFEGFMVGLGMFAFLYAYLTAPDFPTASYVSPHASLLLDFGFVFAFLMAFRFEYFEWRKRASGKST
jgi:hypothetical protein